MHFDESEVCYGESGIVIICCDATHSIILEKTCLENLKLFKLFLSKPVFFKICLITEVFKYIGNIELANESDIIISSNFWEKNMDILYRRVNGNIS